jgi:glycosyltransferase involved in cell wall biosynthesis
MVRPRFSVVIPYHDRAPYLERVLRSLGEQDVPPETLEIVIGSLECSEQLAKLLTGLHERVRVRYVMAREPWNVSRARNLALAQATGEVLLLLDADMLLPHRFLRTLLDHYDLVHNDCAVICQMLDYSACTDVGAVSLCSYDYYRDAYLAQSRRDNLGLDPRWTYRRRLPWSLCWTAVIAIPRRLIERHSLYFDERFTGWGTEDLEWGYRIQRCGVPIIFAEELWSMHLPHQRDVRRNFANQERNYHLFLCKWPCFEVEAVTRFGVTLADERYDELAGARAAVCGSGESVLSVEFSVGASRRLALGVIADARGRLVNLGEIPSVAAAPATECRPLLGLRLPYCDKSLDSTYLLQPLRNMPSEIHAVIRAESERVSAETVLL